MYKAHNIYNDEREMGCQTRQGIDSAEECRPILYILLSRKEYIVLFGRLSRWPGMSLPKWHVRRTIFGGLTLEPLDWDFYFNFCKERCKSYSEGHMLTMTDEIQFNTFPKK